MKHLPLKVAGGVAAIVALVVAAHIGGASLPGGYTDFTERALQTRLGEIPRYRLKPEWAEAGASCRVPVDHPGQLLVNITDRLSSKPAGTVVTEEVLLRIIREEMRC